MHLLPTNLGVLADFTDDSARWACNGIRVQLLPEGKYKLQATDCKTAIEVEGEVVGNEDDYPAWEGLKSAPNGHTSALVSGRSWKSFFTDAKKTVGRRGNPSALRTVAVKIGAEVTTLGATNLDSNKQETLRHVEGQFPPLDNCYPKGTSDIRSTIAFDARKMKQLMDAVCNLNESEIIRVEMEVRDFSKPIMFYSRTSDMSIKALVMPLGDTDGHNGRKSDKPRGCESEITELQLSHQQELARAERRYQELLEESRIRHENYIANLKCEISKLEAKVTELEDAKPDYLDCGSGI